MRGPFPGYPGYNHLPWWAPGRGWIAAPPNLVNVYYVGGTSMSTPHVSAVTTLMLEKNPMLTQTDVEDKLKTIALYIPDSTTGMYVYDYVDGVGWTWTWTSSWDASATGAGLIQADAAVEAVLPPP